MDFRRGSQRDEPEMNLVPMIDVLLVIVIFLVVTTTYSRYSELQINLPSAQASQAQEKPNQINVAITANGRYVVERVPLGAAHRQERRRPSGMRPADGQRHYVLLGAC